MELLEYAENHLPDFVVASDDDQFKEINNKLKRFETVFNQAIDENERLIKKQAEK